MSRRALAARERCGSGRDPMNHDIQLVRLSPRQMAQVTIVVRCGKIHKFRLRLAMALMRIAGRLGGFKQVKLVREARSSHG